MSTSLDPIESALSPNHSSTMAVYLISDLNDADFTALAKVAFVADSFLSEGAIVYVGIENIREMWSNFSDGFFEVVAKCELEGYEWLRFCP